MNSKRSDAPTDVSTSIPCDVIRVSWRLCDLTGVGLEYYAEDGVVRARFYDGQMLGALGPGNTEDTKPVSEG